MTEPFDRVLTAYGTKARALTAMLGTDVSVRDPDRLVVEQWAGTVSGRVLDVGSGTGRWSGHLAELGHDIEGLDPVKEFVDIARQAHPMVPFRHASIADLAGSGERWAGILAWYSLMHCTPDELVVDLSTLHSALTQGGSILLSFFTGPRFEMFDHPVAAAYRWPVELMSALLISVGFAVEQPGASSDTDPNGSYLGTQHAALIAKRAGVSSKMTN